MATHATMNRVCLIVLDSVGIGELPDAARFGDEGSHTLRHAAESVGGLEVPHLERLGLGCIEPIPGVGCPERPQASYGKMAEQAAGKDTTTGHWELTGVVLDRPFPVYPDGFPPEVIEAFEAAIGRKVLGNKPASGTVIIEELGPEHLRTGRPIVYTSADSVFQIAAHESVIPVEELYRMCETARRILTGPHAVGRVIARPFEGRPGSFRRTPRRRDFSLAPPRPTLLDRLVEAGLSVWAVGKVEDIFAGRGITEAVHTRDNDEGVAATLDLLRRTRQQRGLIFTNLVDFDTLWGHRNDPVAYARGLEAFDRQLPGLLGELRERDVLILTADHGNDPATPSTDHSREYVPLLVTGPAIRPGVDLGVRRTFADVAATVAELLGIPARFDAGRSFAADVLA
ncbi:phosphopentomutase [Geochorda subterranea]|uniref:Phosphopentomutase n=1 Tax=Geochorda subterranea TaxID=3109564 RepID=A0ABZ1BK94_9FIRM|nr:phosphopentomutase [Limnochorda sp. LNt]WRP13292.1 phosphopentomutase [Limnochorda sp. LNt]